MRCHVCGGRRFVSTEYKMGTMHAPALACARCHAIVLEEAVARTEGERDSVRRAIALRKAVQDSASVRDESGVFAIGSTMRPAEGGSSGRQKTG